MSSPRHLSLLGRLSFRQLLAGAFLLVAALMAAASLYGLLTIEQLARQSRHNIEWALRVNGDALALAEHIQTMERTGRQALVLEDPDLLARFDAAAREADDAFARLHGQLGDALPTPAWQAARAAVSGAMARPGDALHETTLGHAFRALAQQGAEAALAARRAIDAGNATLLAAHETGRQRVGRLLIAATLAAAVLAVLLGRWLLRPVRQLERVIVALGEDKREQSIAIDGPVDLQRLGQRLDWLRRRLDELETSKTLFLRHVSHELKTPLAALREGSSLLEEGVAGELNAGQREIVQILRQHTHRLQGQIEALLRFNAAAFEASQIRPSRVEIGALVADVLDTHRLTIQARNLRVDIEGVPRTIETDAEKLRIAVDNLLRNAIRFSPPGGRIHVGVTLVEAAAADASGDGASRRLRIDIADEGPGVAARDREHVFEPFYRGAHQPDAGDRGSGIGLSIVREYVLAQRGNVLLLPSAQGAHFRIELPHDD